MKLFIYVEGQEEELFVNRVLRNYLRSFGVAVQKPILAATSFRIGSDEGAEVTIGGVTNYDAIREDIRNLFANDAIEAGDVLTSFIDLYALLLSFPGSDQSAVQGLRGGKKAELIEQEWKVDIGRPNFFPYIQVHEFEALVLTRPSALEGYYPEHAASIAHLTSDCKPFRTPEDINILKSHRRPIASWPGFRPTGKSTVSAIFRTSASRKSRFTAHDLRFGSNAARNVSANQRLESLLVASRQCSRL